MGSADATAGSRPTLARPAIRRLRLRDIGDALAQGFEDFKANPTHLVVLGLVYPVMGLLLGRLASGYDTLALIYPLIGGFALIGPIAAVGLYEFSRRREQGLSSSWRNALDVLHSPRIGAIVVLGGVLGVLFVAWMIAAKVVYNLTLGETEIASLTDLVHLVFTTPAGWTLAVVGTGIGFLFAVVALTVGVVSIPLLVDRDVGSNPGDEASVAIATSVRAVLANPLPMAVWGLIVAVGLVIGAATLLVGFAVIMPVLGHATWHLYRKTVV